MSIHINRYNNPTITHWELDDNGNKISVKVLNENITVVDGKAVLQGLPDSRYRVYIEGMTEIDLGEPIRQADEYKVDYRHTGTIFFHDDLEGHKLVVNRYYSKGVVYYPASRIWTRVDELGNVEKTLDAVMDDVDYIYENIKHLDDNIALGEELYRQLNESIDKGNESQDILSQTIYQADNIIETLAESNRLGDETIGRLLAAIQAGDIDRINNELKALDESKASKDEVNEAINAIPDVFHDMAQGAITEDMIPLDFDYGLTICSQNTTDTFPSINNYGVSFTIKGTKANYAQIFITTDGDIWSRRSGVVSGWNGWYSNKKEIDKKADKDDIPVHLNELNVSEDWKAPAGTVVEGLQNFKADKSELIELEEKLFQSGVESNKILVDALNSKNIKASTDDTIRTNVKKVNDIQVGDYSIGDILTPQDVEALYDVSFKDKWTYKTSYYGEVSIGANRFGESCSGSKQGEVTMLDQDGNKKWVYFGDTMEEVTKVVVGDDSYVYAIVDHSLVVKINPLGDEVWRFSDSSRGINDITIDRYDNVYCASMNNKVIKLSPTGRKLWEYSTSLYQPKVVAAGVDGSVFYATEKIISKLDSEDGNDIWKQESNNRNISALDVGIDGSLYIGDTSGDIEKIDPQGYSAWKVSSLSAIDSISMSMDGYLYVATVNSIAKIDMSGKVIWKNDSYGSVISSINALNYGNLFFVTKSTSHRTEIDKITNYRIIG